MIVDESVSPSFYRTPYGMSAESGVKRSSTKAAAAKAPRSEYRQRELPDEAPDDLDWLADELDRRIAWKRLPRRHRGRKIIRDTIASVVRCSMLRADQLVNQLKSSGRLNFQSAHIDVGDRRYGRWTICMA